MQRGALGSAPFDSEGVATRDRELVVHGVLDGYLLDAYSARKLGLVTTGNAGGVHNLVVQGHMLDPKTLLKKLGTGLLVTEMMGQGVNPVTGDYSRGASGFWVENGELVRPVHEITVAGNLREIQRARQRHGLAGTPARLRLAIAAAWLGDVIRSLLGDRAYGWCADAYRVARGKSRIWTV